MKHVKKYTQNFCLIFLKCVKVAFKIKGAYAPGAKTSLLLASSYQVVSVSCDSLVHSVGIPAAELFFSVASWLRQHSSNACKGNHLVSTKHLCTLKSPWLILDRVFFGGGWRRGVVVSVVATNSVTFGKA
jgi:hypothetical protein